MRIERDGYAWACNGPRLPRGFGQKRLMPKMNAVKVADGDGAMATSLGNGGVQGLAKD
jgi:hypothetical protein